MSICSLGKRIDIIETGLDFVHFVSMLSSCLGGSALSCHLCDIRYALVRSIKILCLDADMPSLNSYLCNIFFILKTSVVLVYSLRLLFCTIISGWTISS